MTRKTTATTAERNDQRVVRLPARAPDPTMLAVPADTKATATRSARHMSDSYHAAPAEYLPEPSRELMLGLDEAIREAEAELAPTDPTEVLKAMYVIAERKEIPLPPEHLLALDAEFIAEIPKDLFGEAFKCLYTSFRWRRMPEVADWIDTVREEIDARKAELGRLKRFRSRLLLKAEDPGASTGPGRANAGGLRQIGAFLPVKAP